MLIKVPAIREKSSKEITSKPYTYRTHQKYYLKFVTHLYGPTITHLLNSWDYIHENFKTKMPSKELKRSVYVNRIKLIQPLKIHENLLDKHYNIFQNSIIHTI